jgi:dTDP-4-dehydrorhamnose 3,5-epimerase
MKIEPTALRGVLRIALDSASDARGTFVKCFDAEKFRAHGLCDRFEQFAEATNVKAGIIRGLHYQAAPLEEVKLIRCTRGTIYDVVVDVRDGSATRGRWQACTLTGDAADVLYVPAGFAHGYQVLADDTAVEYLISAPFAEQLQRGVHFRSPVLKIAWPMQALSVSSRDEGLPPFS